MGGTFWLVDGTALAYRSHFAFVNNPLRNPKGQDTSATFGYVRAILDILRNEKPDAMAVAFDVSRETFRKEMYPAYKATREKAPEELKAQFPWIKEVTEALGIPILEREGYEADDLIGSAVKQAVARGYDVRIVSGDKDMMQLVSDRVRIYDVGRRSGPVEIDAAGVEEKFGVGPDKVTDVLGLMGDASDNVPGVPLVGPKKATALVREFGSLEEVLRRAPAGKPSKTQQNLVEFADQARLSRELVTIKTDLEIDLPLAPPDPATRDHETLARLFRALDFRQLLKELAGATAVETSAERYRTVHGDDALRSLAEDLRAAGFFVLDTETTSLDPFTADIVGLSFSWRAQEAAYVPWSDRAAELLKPLLEDGAVEKGAQNAKFDLQVLLTHGIDVNGLSFDTMIASYLLEPGRGGHNLDAMSLRHLNIKKTPTEELIGKGKSRITMAEVAEDTVARYACEDADCTFRLVEFFQPRLAQEGLKRLFDEVEMPLVPVLMAMERAGVAVDVPYLGELSVEFADVAHELEREVTAIAGEAINLHSPRQLGPLLFEKLEIAKGSRKRPRRTKTGAYSTDAQTLEAYAAHPIVKKLLEYREVTKLKSTYVDALPQMVRPFDGRIHSSFNQTVTATGRLSSDNPNLQNIPVRTELGRRIRRAFIAEKGCQLLSADYNQIELRLMAHLSGDPGLCDLYARGGDVHTETAALMFGIEPEEVTREQRNSAKAINFGILYGMGSNRLARDLKISLREAKAFLNAYFREFPRVREFQIAAVEKARRDGFVTTLLGRRRAIPEIDSEQPGVRANAENIAKNTPLQGTASDLIKVAMIRVHDRLRAEGYAARMILQVHDELVFEAPEEEIERLGQLVRDEMEGALELKVPIVVEVGVGDNWLEAH